MRRHQRLRWTHNDEFTDALDSKFSDESDELADEGISAPERAYRGPHLVFPLQKKDVDTLIELFRKKKVSLWSEINEK